jgi:hypothetical protein
MTDPNPFLSTIVQSSATLVAIIGGLIASRVISIITDREFQRHRAQELESQFNQSLLPELKAKVAFRVRLEALEFLQGTLSEIIYARGEISAEQLIKAGHDSSLTNEELQPFVSKAAAVVRRMFALAGQAASGVPMRLSPDELEAGGLAAAQGHREVFDLTVEAIKAAERNQPLPPVPLRNPDVETLKGRRMNEG